MPQSPVRGPEPVIMSRGVTPANSSTSIGSSSNDQSFSKMGAQNGVRRQNQTDDDEGFSRHSYTMAQVQHAMEVPIVETSPTTTSSGFLSSSLAWMQRTQERRKRQYLQLQAERQLRKIAEAERSNMSREPTLQLSLDGSNKPIAETDSPKYGTPQLSKSGEGATAQLDWHLQEEDYTIPTVRVEKETGEDETPTILTAAQMQEVAIHVLPQTISYCQWRRTYSLGRDGDSFEACLRSLEGAKRTLMVVRTTRGDVFGGYADSPWRTHQQGGTQFYGSAQSSLFSFASLDSNPTNTPNKIRVYRWTGKNRYIQLCDTSSKLFAFGGGGEDGAFGLCVQEDFQKGSTGPCDTFGNDPLCSQNPFEIVDVEFWQFLTGVF